MSKYNNAMSKRSTLASCYVQTRRSFIYFLSAICLLPGHVAPTSDVTLLYNYLNESFSNSNGSITLWNNTQVPSSNIFAHTLWTKYAGPDEELDKKELDNLLVSARGSLVSEEAAKSNNSQYYSLCDGNKKLCLLLKPCFSAKDIFDLNNVQSKKGANFTEFLSLLPTLVFAVQQSECNGGNITSTGRPKHKPPVAKVWGFGFLCVTLINLCSLLGMVFIPLTHKSFYKKILMFMVALGVGTLTGSSLLFLIPECFGLTHDDSPYKDEYVWKATVVIGGIYLFFLTERILQGIMDKRDQNSLHHDHAHVGSIKLKSRTRHDSSSMNMSFGIPESTTEKGNMCESSSSNLPNSNESQISQKPLITQSNQNIEPELKEQDKERANFSKGNGHYHVVPPRSNSKKQIIKSVAWMVIFGDGLHNFIDGLSIGAAFSESIMAGISVSLAVICEELPHELGDFAILLNSGMRVKQALLYNFLSACMCYFGLVIGIVIGEMTTGSTWIFAIAGGMFLYISLVDMLPEVNHAAQEEVKEGAKQVTVFLLQNAGLLTGYGLMLFLALFTAKIDFEN